MIQAAVSRIDYFTFIQMEGKQCCQPSRFAFKCRNNVCLPSLIRQGGIEVCDVSVYVFIVKILLYIQLFLGMSVESFL